MKQITNEINALKAKLSTLEAQAAREREVLTKKLNTVAAKFGCTTLTAFAELVNSVAPAKPVAGIVAPPAVKAVVKPKRKRTKVTPELIASMKELATAGKTVAEISVMKGVHRDTVTRAIA
jgi:hypothetical protein